jgi:uncharacterized protein YciI
MHYAITNIDHPGRNWLRTDLRPKHIEYLRAPHEGVKLVLAGPFINEDNGEMIGSLLIVSADDVAAVLGSGLSVPPKAQRFECTND